MDPPDMRRCTLPACSSGFPKRQRLDTVVCNLADQITTDHKTPTTLIPELYVGHQRMATTDETRHLVSSTPMINASNPIVQYGVTCNTDLQFVGDVYNAVNYVTHYITKPATKAPGKGPHERLQQRLLRTLNNPDTPTRQVNLIH